MLSYLLVGHITRDITATGVLLGGTASYASYVMAALGTEVRIVTAAAEVPESEFEHAELAVQLGPDTTMLEHEWKDGRRYQWIRRRAATIHGRDIPEAWRESDVWHLAPMVGELDRDVLEVIPPNVFVGMTAQGWMRAAGPNEEMLAAPWHGADDWVPRMNGIVFSEEDIEDADSWAGRWAGPNRVVAVTKSTRGSDLFLEHGQVHVPAFPAEARDETGAGDVYAAALFFRLAAGDVPLQAGLFASAAAALSVGGSGPTCVPTLARVEALLQQSSTFKESGFSSTRESTTSELKTQNSEPPLGT